MAWRFSTRPHFSLKTYTAVRLSKEFETLTLFTVPIDGVRMLSLLQVLNTLLVVGFTFLVSRFTEKRSERATSRFTAL